MVTGERENPLRADGPVSHDVPELASRTTVPVSCAACSTPANLHPLPGRSSRSDILLTRPVPMLVTRIVLALATLLCGLVAGFLFAFAVVVMPGIRGLESGAFLRAFQEVDGVIQRGQPLFGLVWLGSVVALVAASVLGIAQLRGVERSLLLIATTIYVVGVQVPTFTVNVPLNNEVQELVIEAMDTEAQQTARERFETRWNYWNVIRTVCATVAVGMLIVLLLRL